MDQIFLEVKKIDNVVFGHTRLAIIDLNKNANQPMSDIVEDFVLFIMVKFIILKK